MENKKKLIVIGTVVLIVILLIISFNIKDNDKDTKLSNDVDTIIENAQKESNNVKESEKKSFLSIDVTKYLEFYSGSEKQLVLVARPTCSYCQIAEPIIQSIAYEYNIGINYLNTDEFSEDDQNNFIHSDEFFEEGFGTPLLLVVSNNQINDKVDGLTDREHYIDFIKNNGFIG